MVRDQTTAVHDQTTVVHDQTTVVRGQTTAVHGQTTVVRVSTVARPEPMPETGQIIVDHEPMAHHAATIVVGRVSMVHAMTVGAHAMMVLATMAHVAMIEGLAPTHRAAMSRPVLVSQAL